jgi:DNA-nicking Smr family endonuclease
LAPKDEHDLFAEAMSKVQPIAPAKKITIEKNRRRLRDFERIADKAAAGSPVPIPSTAPHAPRLVSSDEPWTLIANGISRERLKQLAAGQPPVEGSFDLHGITRQQALDLLTDGFQQALIKRQRALCIIHGRGLHSEGKAVLKHETYHWLQEGPFAPYVLAVIPQPGSGGGACLVLLRRQ